MGNPGKIVLVFEVYEGGEFQRREELSAESVTIGRGVAAMLRIDSPALADLQAVINVGDDGEVRLLDVVGADGGTKVNGAAVNNCVLRTGDEMAFGAVRVKVAVIDAGAFSDDEATQLGKVVDLSKGAVAAAPAAALERAAAAGDDEDEDAEESEVSEDVVAFIMRSGTSTSDAGIDKKLPKVLEVAEAWSNTLLDVKHFPKGHRAVTVGSSTGTRWRILGLPIAWVPSAASAFAWLAGPTISETTEEWKNDFYGPPENMPDADFKLFESSGGGFVANISDKWTGFVDVGEERHSFQQLIAAGKAKASGAGVYQVEITEDTRLFADTGHVYFFGQMVHPSKRVVSNMADGIDYPFLGSMTFMSFVFFLLSYVYVVSPTPPEPEMVEIPDRFVELVLEEPPPIEEPKKEQSKPDANPDAGEGAKAKGEEGKVGKKDAKMKEAKGDKVAANKQQLDKEVAENAGVLGALRDGGSSMDGFGSSALNSDLTGGIGGLVGAKGTQMGSGGLGSRGGGLGGGGTAEGLGGLGTKGRGSGASGYGTGGGNFGSRGEGGIGKIGGDPIILGALDKSLIDAVIKRNMNQIRYCYQRELTKNPSLGGKVTVKFVIAKDGTVSKADIKQGMGSAAVESCIAGRFMRFKFPEPKGGGIVIVSYPFIFSPG